MTDTADHPLRNPRLRVDVAFREHGLDDQVPRRIWSPWAWERVENLYYRIGYVPSPGQREFHMSPARVKVMCCGARYGKSMSAAREILPVVLSPGTRTWILGPTYDLAEKEWRVLMGDLQALGLLELATKNTNANNRCYLEFPWGAQVWTRSADNPQSLLGEELDCVLLSEASQLPEKVWTRFVRARVGSRLGRVIIPTTPFGYNWIRDQWERGKKQAEADGDVAWSESIAAWQFSVLENPHFDPVEYLTAQRDLPPEEFAEQYDGRFTMMSGRVFPMFRKHRHVVDRRLLPNDLLGMPICRTVDFGFSNPTACLWVVYDHNGVCSVKPRSWWVVSELYRKQMLTEQLAADIKANEWSQRRILFTIGDMADAQARATLTRHGIPCAQDVSRVHDGQRVPIDKAWAAGIRTLRELLNTDRIRISSDCTNLIRELSQASFADDHKDRQEPGQDDHATDALRYLVHTLTPV